MLNCSTSSICALCSQLMLMQLMRDGSLAAGWNIDQTLSDGDVKECLGWLKIATVVADDFELQPVANRIDAIKKKLGKRHRITQREYGIELRVLLETLQTGLQHQFLYRYPNKQKAMLERWQQDWGPSIRAFPSAAEDIKSAVDLWALGYYTSAVFHAMRILEHGLKALSEEMGVSVSVENWQNIIDQIEARIKDAAKTLPRGLERSERLQFLSASAKEFYYFKDGWRNYVSHNRSKYDEAQAKSAVEHVRAFMNTISSRLSENNVREVNARGIRLALEK